MNPNDPSDPLLPPPREGHHRSARERQRRGPILGLPQGPHLGSSRFSRFVFSPASAGWWYLGSSNFAEYVRNEIEATLEARLRREVTIRSVEFVRTTPQKIILNDVRIANAPGGVARHFATIRQIEITGNVQILLGT